MSLLGGAWEVTMQWHFEFKDWEEAFRHFYRKRCGEQLIDDVSNDFWAARF
jgi:hypothetical protein